MSAYKVYNMAILFLSGFCDAGFQPSDEDIYLLGEENGLNVPIPHYINDEDFVGLANEFLDEPVTITRRKFTHALFSSWKQIYR